MITPFLRQGQIHDNGIYSFSVGETLSDKIIYFWIMLFLIPLSGYTQGFNKRESKDFDVVVFKNILLQQDTFYTNTQIIKKGNNFNSLPYTFQFSLNGDRLSAFSKMQDSLIDYFPNNGFVRHYSTFVSSGSFPAPTPKFVYLKLVNVQDSTDQYFFYTDSTRSYFDADLFIDCEDSSFAFVGSSQKSGQLPDMNVFYVDKYKQKKWNKYFNPMGLDARSTCVYQKPNTHLIVAGHTAYKNPPVGNLIDFAVWRLYYELDTAGNILKQYTHPNDSVFGTVALLPTADGGYITGSSKEDLLDSQGTLGIHGYISKIDSNYQTIWGKEIANTNGISQFNQIKKLHDGNYLAVGECLAYNEDSTVPTSDPYKLLYMGWLVKFTEQGAVLWDRKYYGVASFQEFNRLFDFAELPNGDIIACGESTNMYTDSLLHTDSVRQEGWLLRVNAQGCLSPTDCGYTAIIETKSQPIKINIFPNPTTDKLCIETFALNQSSAYSFTLSDQQGKQISAAQLAENSSLILETKNLSSAMYFITIFENKQPVYSHKIIVNK